MINNKRCTLVVLSWVFNLNAFAATEMSWELGSRPKLIEEIAVLRDSVDSSIQHDVIQLLHRRSYQISDSGVTEKVENAYLFNTLEAIHNYGEEIIYWDSSGEKIRFTESVVIGANGVRTEFDPATVQIIDTNSYDVFSDLQKVVVQPPALSPGAINIVAYEKEIDSELPFFFNGYVNSAFFRKRVEINVDWVGKKPAWHSSSDVLKCSESQLTMHCYAENLQPVDTDYSVQYEDYVSQFTVAKKLDWDDVIDQISEKVESAISDSVLLDDTFLNLSKSDDLIEAIHEFVSRDIRYVSFSEGEHSHLPHKIDTTINNRYGDCKDKSTLLLALLTKAGVKAYPSLVSTTRGKPEKLAVPGVGYFDHMIVCMDTAQGELCMDPTDAFSKSTMTPGWIQGKVKLDLNRGENPSKIPLDKYRWELNVKTDVVFSKDGGTTEVQARVYSGEYGSSMRQTLSALNTKDRIEWLRNQYSEDYAKDLKPEFLVRNLFDVNQPLEIESTVKFEPFLSVQDSLSFNDSARWLNSIINRSRNKNTHYEYEFPGIRIKSVYSFNLNGVWSYIDSGATVILDSQFGKMTRNYHRQDNKITVETLAELPNSVIPQDSFDQFDRFIDLILDESDIRIWGESVLSR